VGVGLREARADDRSDIDEIHARSVRGLCAEHYSPEQLEGWIAERATAEPVDGLVVLLAVDDDDRPVGFVELDLEGSEVRSLFVVPEVAGAGLGARLLEAAEERARSEGLGELSLFASSNAIGFYESRGYARVFVGEKRAKQAPPLRCTCMSRSLS
jgi:GNAT superfamily N-acetyltransferase